MANLTRKRPTAESIETMIEAARRLISHFESPTAEFYRKKRKHSIGADTVAVAEYALRKAVSPSIRDLMIDEIKMCGWLDSEWPESDCHTRTITEQTPQYMEYLRSLSDSDLLFTYNRVRDDCNNLD